MKTPDQVREYEEQKRAVSQREWEKRQAVIDVRKKEYLAFLHKELDAFVDAEIEKGDITSNGGTIDVKILFDRCSGKDFGGFFGLTTGYFGASDFVKDITAYLKKYNWKARFSEEHEVCCGPEPSYTERGNFIHIAPIK